MSNPIPSAELEEYREKLINENEDQLRDIHAVDYMGTDDDMPEAFEAWLENLTVMDLESYLQ